MNQNHPVADLFPMLADDELRELAADIKTRGLLQPIVKDQQGRILDGRNRLAACKLAGVKPEFVTYSGDDADGYALAVNIQRRNLSKGQRAMIAAQAQRVTRNVSLRGTADVTGLSRERIRLGSVVLEFAPDLTDNVVSGVMPLDEAYRIAQERKREAESDTAKLASLRNAYPELADRVTEGELTLNGALAEMRERQAGRQRDIEQGRRMASSLVNDLMTAVNTIAIAHKQGERLVTSDMVNQCQDAVSLLASLIGVES